MKKDADTSQRRHSEFEPGKAQYSTSKFSPLPPVLVRINIVRLSISKESNNETLVGMATFLLSQQIQTLHSDSF